MLQTGEERGYRSPAIAGARKKLDGIWSKFQANDEALKKKGEKCEGDEYFVQSVYGNAQKIKDNILRILNKVTEEESEEAVSTAQQEELYKPQGSSKWSETCPNESKEIRLLESTFSSKVAALNAMIREGQEVDDKYFLKKLNDNLEKMRWILLDLHTEMGRKGAVNEFIEDLWEQANMDYYQEQKRIRQLLKTLDEAERMSMRVENIKMPEFSGRLEDWNTFFELFNTLIHKDPSSTDEEKLFRLKSAVKGDALQIIRNMPLTSTGYKTALETLRRRYDNKRNLFGHYLDKLLDQPMIDGSSSESVKKLLDTSTECIEGIKAMDLKLGDAYPILAHVILRKFDKEARLQYEQTTKKTTDIQDIADVLKFLEQRYLTLSSVWSKNEGNIARRQYNLDTAATKKQDDEVLCGYCKKTMHKTYQCQQYNNLTVRERMEWVKKNELCTNCLNHKATRRCGSRMNCFTCNGRHHTSLHISKTDTSGNKSTFTTMEDSHHVLIATAQIRVKSKLKEFITLRALIDPCAQTSSISEEAVQFLQLPKLKTDVTLHGLGGAVVGKAKSKVIIEVKPRFLSDYAVNIEAVVLPELASVQQNPTCEYEINKWDNFTLADPDFASSDRIDVLIGSDIYHEIAQDAVHKKDTILAQKTKLGWILSGPVTAKKRSNEKIVATTTLERFWEIEELFDSQEVEDDGCLAHYKSTTSTASDGRFVVRLPFKEDIELGDSYKRAMARFLSVEKQLNRNVNLRADYDQFMEEYIRMGHMVRVQSDLRGKYYLPHQAVIRESSLTTRLSSTGELQLHGFADASERAYAAVVYAKVGGSVQLVAARSKVNPIKNRKTLPKLELCAAHLLARLIAKIKGVIEMEAEVFMWSDSTITLSWIRNGASRDKFIRTRVTEIQQWVPIAKWRYVKSKENPADMGSRGISPEKLPESGLWWEGPEWLRQDEESWYKDEPGCVNVATTTVRTNPIYFNHILEKYSSFRRLKRVVAYVLRYIEKLRGKTFPEFLTVVELREAETIIIKGHQQEEFPEILTMLQNGAAVDHKHKLASLNPYLDEEGLMRVGGRLQLSSLAYNEKHPVILNKSNLSDLIIKEAHEATLHGCIRVMENLLRRNYWMIGMKSSIKRVNRSCVKCIRYKQESRNQLMGILPNYRVNVSAPFTHCGVDYAGPIYMKCSNERGQRAYKGYVAVFICMATKAIHLEPVSSLTSEAFLAALKRLFARRGKSSHMYSDNGTNFVGALKHLDKDFRDAIKENSTLAPILAAEKIQWHFIPPASPHFGGIWEAAVKAMKYHLRRIVGESKLTFEEMSTLLYQIEAVLNSRPLYHLDENTDEMDVLTPGHFLIGRPLIGCPETASVVESTVNILRTTMEDVNSNFKKIVDQMNNITAAMEETYFVYRKSIRFFMVTKDLDAIIRENERVQSSMINLLIDINHGKLNPSLITPVQLQAEMIRIREHMPERLKFPGKKYEQIRAVYKLLTAKATLIEDKLIVSANIPLFTQNTIHQTTGKTPYQIVFGQQMITHGQDYKLLKKLQLLEESDIQIQREDKFTVMRNKIQEKMKAAYEKNMKIYNAKARNTIHQTTGKTPYQIVFGQQMITHGQDYKLLKKLQLLEESDIQIQREDKFTVMRNKIQEKMKAAYEKNMKIYNAKARYRELKIGQEVIRRNFVQSSHLNHFSSKLAPIGIKAIVLRKLGKVNYELQDCESGKIAVYHLKDIWT
ncbi:uncharacterized protein [Musca autumnalis]|uniref:uncharacterized protein n=1 Tax=Musca autumnalis TaxID=221902 RepID=UPI003CE7401D